MAYPLRICLCCFPEYGFTLGNPGLGSIFGRHLWQGIGITKTRTACIPGTLTEEGVLASSEGCGLEWDGDFLFSIGAL